MSAIAPRQRVTFGSVRYSSTMLPNIWQIPTPRSLIPSPIILTFYRILTSFPDRILSPFHSTTYCLYSHEVEQCRSVNKPSVLSTRRTLPINYIYIYLLKVQTTSDPFDFTLPPTFSENVTDNPIFSCKSAFFSLVLFFLSFVINFQVKSFCTTHLLFQRLFHSRCC